MYFSVLVYSEGKLLYKADVSNPSQSPKLFGVAPEDITTFTYDPLNQNYYIGTAKALYLLQKGKTRPMYLYLLFLYCCCSSKIFCLEVVE